MSKRLVHKVIVNGHAAVAQVYYNSDLYEYVVELREGRRHVYPDFDYFTNDKDDAISTASAILQELILKEASFDAATRSRKFKGIH
jgi:hypothetical protein